MLSRLAILVLTTGGCRDQPAPARVAIVGIDGGDWDVLDPLIESGLLPNLARVRQQGSTAPLAVDSGKSPESWTTLASGTAKARHGVFIPDGPLEASIVPQSQVQVSRLWDIATRSRRRVLLVDWWVNWPPYPIEGVMVSRDCPLCPGSLASSPPDAVRRLGPPIAPSAHREDMDRLGLLADESTAVMRGWLDEPFDLAMLPFYGLDASLHVLWSDYQLVARGQDLSQLDAEEAVRIQTGYEIVVQAAEMADTLLGDAIEWAGPDGFVLVVSDHGHTGKSMPLRRLAISRRLIDSGRGTTSRGSFRVDGQPVTVGVRQRIAGSNVKGARYQWRYPVIEQAPDSLRERLLATTTQDGQPMFVQEGTTLVPSPQLERTARNAVGGHSEDAFTVYVTSGEHDEGEPGIFGLLGPGVAPGALSQQVRSVDVAPTVLWLMGLPVGEDMDGHAITAALAPPGRPLLTVATHEDGSRPWAVDAAPPQVDRERLRALGYAE